jgi:hypothetical protein
MIIRILLVISLFGCDFEGIGQVKLSVECYNKERLSNPEEHVFRKMDIFPAFVTGVDGLHLFLLDNINFSTFMDPRSLRYISDTANIEFIVSKDGSMSDLNVSDVRYQALKSIIVDLFERSSCNWIPGSSGGRSLNAYKSLALVIEVDRRGAFIKTNIQVLQ